MMIYIASSWRNESGLKLLATMLRGRGHEVDCFCDSSTGRYAFHWTEFVEHEDDLKNYDAKEFLADERTLRAFDEDKKWLDWAEVVILVLPSGRSAHLEAGYAKGQGKKLYIFGNFPKGEFDVMYGFADGLYRIEEMSQLLLALNHGG